jgi:Rap1a immunity proteins
VLTLIAAITMVLLVLVGHVRAEEQTIAGGKPGKMSEWIANCNGPDYAKLHCMGYALGIADGLMIWSDTDPKRGKVCLPPKIKTDELIAVALTIAKVNPELQDFPAGWVITLAYERTWPCKRGAR